VTDWFKQHTFTGGLVATTLLLALAGLYFAYSENAAFVEQTDAFTATATSLRQLQDSKPFPDEDNLRAAESEAKLSATILEDLAAEVAKQAPPLQSDLTPRDFQDKLSAAAAEAEETAAANKAALPEDFYLGFGDYKAQPPPEAAAPMLGQQLETIANVTGLLLKSGIKELTGIERAPLPMEAGPPKEESESDQAGDPNVRLAPFDVEFVADPSGFRNALSAIITSRPIVLVRLVSVVNSSPAPPIRESATAEPAIAAPPTAGEGKADIPVVFGREPLKVKLRLASVSVAAPPVKK